MMIKMGGKMEEGGESQESRRELERRTEDIYYIQ